MYGSFGNVDYVEKTASKKQNSGENTVESKMAITSSKKFTFS